MGFLDKAKDLLSKNADKVDTAINKAGDLVDKKTQGKYAQHVNKVQDSARSALKNTDKNTTGQSGQVPPTQQSGQAPPPQPPPSTPPQQQPPTAPPTS